MVFIIVLFFIFIISIILSLFSKGETQQEAKEVVNDIVTGPNGKTLLMVLVQKLQDNYNKSIKLGHTDTITLERVRD
jgi:hypothetical protein